jgi:FolB domain-containing protein
MTTKIHIDNFITKANIGITETERAQPQSLILDLTLTIDARKAIITDNVIHTLSYSTLQKSIQSLIQENTYNLLETLADKIARLCFESPLVQEVEISIRKPNILLQSESAGITFSANKHEYSLS